MAGKELLKLAFGKPFTIALLAASVAYVQPYRPLVFVGHSMEPTYSAYSLAMTVPVAGPLHRGDVVVVENPELGTVVKRVAYVAGDRIPQLNIHGEWVDLYDIKLRTVVSKTEFREYIIPDNYVYLLGDNRRGSLDSRIYGCVSTDDVKRVVVHAKPYVEPPVSEPVAVKLVASRFHK